MPGKKESFQCKEPKDRIEVPIQATHTVYTYKNTFDYGTNVSLKKRKKSTHRIKMYYTWIYTASLDGI